MGPLFANPFLWTAVLTYVAVMGLFVLGLKWWGEMSALYPIYGSTFVFGLFFSSVWLNERPTSTAVAGTFLVIVGIGLLSREKELS